MAKFHCNSLLFFSLSPPPWDIRTLRLRWTKKEMRWKGERNSLASGKKMMASPPSSPPPPPSPHPPRGARAIKTFVLLLRLVLDCRTYVQIKVENVSDIRSHFCILIGLDWCCCPNLAGQSKIHAGHQRHRSGCPTGREGVTWPGESSQAPPGNDDLKNLFCQMFF